MEDRSQEVLLKYDFKVYNTYRTRGAFVLETDQGLKLLCACEGSEQRIEFEHLIKQQILQSGYTNIDLFVLNSEGTIISVNSAGDRYFMKEWFDGEECSLKKEEKIFLGTRNLARLHNCMEHIELPTSVKQVYEQSDLRMVFEKRTRELKRVKTYIRERKQKSEFEVFYLSVCEQFYRDALDAMEFLQSLPYDRMREKAREAGTVCHGSYTYHNIISISEMSDSKLCKAAQLNKENKVATTNFEKAECGLQVLDLYYYLRKAMEKNDWNLMLGDKIISEYKNNHSFSEDNRKLLYTLLLYPEKFWKITNYYYNSKKSWIPQKNVQKLQLLGEQMESKRRFVQSIL